MIPGTWQQGHHVGFGWLSHQTWRVTAFRCYFPKWVLLVTSTLSSPAPSCPNMCHRYYPKATEHKALSHFEKKISVDSAAVTVRRKLLWEEQIPMQQTVGVWDGPPRSRPCHRHLLLSGQSKTRTGWHISTHTWFPPCPRLFPPESPQGDDTSNSVYQPKQQ